MERAFLRRKALAVSALLSLGACTRAGELGGNDAATLSTRAGELGGNDVAMLSGDSGRSSSGVVRFLRADTLRRGGQIPEDEALIDPDTLERGEPPDYLEMGRMIRDGSFVDEPQELDRNPAMLEYYSLIIKDSRPHVDELTAAEGLKLLYQHGFPRLADALSRRVLSESQFDDTTVLIRTAGEIVASVETRAESAHVLAAALERVPARWYLLESSLDSELEPRTELASQLIRVLQPQLAREPVLRRPALRQFLHDLEGIADGGSFRNLGNWNEHE